MCNKLQRTVDVQGLGRRDVSTRHVSGRARSREAMEGVRAGKRWSECHGIGNLMPIVSLVRQRAVEPVQGEATYDSDTDESIDITHTSDESQSESEHTSDDDDGLIVYDETLWAYYC